MKKALLSGIALVALFSGSAMAADLMLRKAPPPPPVVGWTGWYVGVHGGAGIGTKEWDLLSGSTFAPGLPPTTIGFGGFGAHQNVNGFLGGAQIGYNWQMGWLVLGVEADW